VGGGREDARCRRQAAHDGLQEPVDRDPRGEQGSKAQIKAFNELGISQQTLKAHGNDLNYMLGAVSDGLKKLPPGTDRSALQAKLFGRTVADALAAAA
jgi:hypothetical protein